jgi:hypothetical protein
MAMEDFAREIFLESRGMDRAERIIRTRQLALTPSTKKFIKRYLPELYDEAFPASNSGAGQMSEFRSPHGLCAKPL